jgi:SHS family sialic acid transporter-like MFS transporter
MIESRGKWLALAAALLGWMFDGLEMGLFPLVARPALLDLGGGSIAEAEIGKWISLATAAFLVGAATGGVFFGFLGDRIGRVRAMTLSVLTYAVFSGLCGLVTSPEQIAILRFLASLGMGGEWSLGVALVMEVWPGRSRAFLAGLIGAAANVGFLVIAFVGGWIIRNLEQTAVLLSLFLSESAVTYVTANSGWRLIMILGGLPAFLTLFLAYFVPESERWKSQRERGTTSSWATKDLAGVGVGLVAALSILYLWTVPLDIAVRISGTVLALVVATTGYLYPVKRYLQRLGSGSLSAGARQPIRRMLLGACLSGVALLGTWGSIQQGPTWADKLVETEQSETSIRDMAALRAEARSSTQFWSALGAIVGTIAGAYLGDLLGRRITYFLLCVGSLASSLYFFQGQDHYSGMFLVAVFLAGALTASFYGWLPLYLPELFSSGMRATGQGFSYNFGRIIAAVGALQMGFLMKEFFNNDYAKACSILSLIYLAGMAIIWVAPETHGRPLPD